MLPFLLGVIAPAYSQDISIESRIVVDLDDSTNLWEIEEIFQQAGMVEAGFINEESVDERLVHGYTEDVEHTLSVLRNHPLVTYAEQDQIFTIPGQEVGTSFTAHSLVGKDDPLFKQQWHLQAATGIDGPWVWDNTKAGQGVIVAVLDTGFTETPDTAANVSPKGKSMVGGSLTDLNGHGTHCASSIAERTRNGLSGAGVAPNSTILPIKVLTDGGFGGVGGIAAGIDYAADVCEEARADCVISMSLGSNAPSPIIHAAIDRVIARGVVVVAAAGNSGRSGRGSVGFPGGYDPVIGVGAIGCKGDWAPYSSYGKGLDLMAPGGDKSQGETCGVGQETAPNNRPGFYWFNGTSMATPHLAGAVAVLLAEGACPVKDATRQKCIEDILTKTATKRQNDSEGKYGNGTINLRRAVESVKADMAPAEWIPTIPAEDAGDTGYSLVPSWSQAKVSSFSEGLPHPNPAGPYTILVTIIAGALGILLSKQQVFPDRFVAVATATAIILSGPLYLLTYTGLDLSLVAPFVVPMLEWPEYVLWKGASGNPLWLSPLPLLLPFFLFLPLRPLRPVVIGATLASTAYLGLNILLQFNGLWWMGWFGAAIWLFGGACINLGMVGAFAEFYRLHKEEP